MIMILKVLLLLTLRLLMMMMVMIIITVIEANIIRIKSWIERNTICVREKEKKTTAENKNNINLSLFSDNSYMIYPLFLFSFFASVVITSGICIMIT